MKVLSFNPCIEADQNLFPPRKKFSLKNVLAIRSADAVILPQGCSKDLYLLARLNCSNVFPNYDAYFRFPGKIGQALLFRQIKVPHPNTRIFIDLESLKKMYVQGCPFDYPCVFKCSWGGEGRYVFLLNGDRDLERCVDMAQEWKNAGQEGYLIQEYVPTGGRSLRVVVIGNMLFSYWRVQKDPRAFYTNLAKGAYVEHDTYPHLQQAARRALRNFCKITGINLAGFDFLFSMDEKSPTALFLEINYFFRYRGLGGRDKFFKLLESGVREWISTKR